MIWEAHDETCTDIQIGNKKILEISNGWHVETVYFPETYCRFDKSMCKPCKICRIYVRRDKIDDYIRYLLEELDYYCKLP